MSAVTCPECGAAAEITERFTLASTDGPVPHVALSCAGGHHYRMTADKLPASAPRRLRVMRVPALKPHTFPVCIHCLVNRPDSGSAARTATWCAGPGACPAARTWTASAAT